MNSWSDISCLVLDVDDTLYLERDYVRSGFTAVDRYIQQTFQETDFFEVSWSLFEAGNRGNVFDVALERIGIRFDQEILKLLVTIYREHVPNISLSDDVMAFLQVAASMHDIAFLTGGPLESQKRKVSALGLDRYSETVVYAGAWGTDFDKPNPRAWLELQSETGFEGKQFLYVGDNPVKDFPAPLALGWQCIRVRQPGSLHWSLPTPSGVREVQDLSAIGDLLWEDIDSED